MVPAQSETIETGVSSRINGVTPIRSGIKPYESTWRDGYYLLGSRRTHDPEYGTEVWRMDDAPAADFSWTTSVFSAWNANGSRLFLRSYRPLPDSGGMHRNWVSDATFSKLYPIDLKGRHPIWSATDPDVYMDHRPGVLESCNLRTQQRKVVARWRPIRGERIFGYTDGGECIFVDLPEAGIWLKADVNVMAASGSPALAFGSKPPGPTSLTYATRTASGKEDWFVPDVNASRSDRQGWIRLRVGLLIDVESGTSEYVIAPARGDEAYLLQYLESTSEIPGVEDGWPDFKVMSADTLEGLFQVYLTLPESTHGHSMVSSDGRFEARDHWEGDGYYLTSLEMSEPEEFRYVGSDSHLYHIHFGSDPRYFMSWVQGHDWMTYHKGEQAHDIVQVFVDDTINTVVNTRHEPYGTYVGADFTMLSPDGTKIHYGSSQDGFFRNYIAVIGKPQPPENVRQVREDGVEWLEWDDPAAHKEIRGYLVYASDSEQGPYKLVSDEIIETSRWSMPDSLRGNGTWFAVTSVEFSGLESGYAQVQEPVSPVVERTVFIEPERMLDDYWNWLSAERELTFGFDRSDASDFRYIRLHPDADEASFPIEVPPMPEGSYRLWLRGRRDKPEAGQGIAGLRAGEAYEPLAFTSSDWAWVASDRLYRESELETLEITLKEHGVDVDVLCVSSDLQYAPDLNELNAQPLLPKVNALESRLIGPATALLKWDTADDARLSHYNIYVSTAGIPTLNERNLLGSTSETEWVDWGLLPGDEYFYAVAAVDLRGNVGAPAYTQVKVDADTQEKLELLLEFSDAELAGKFEEGEAYGLLSDKYVVPLDSQSNSVCWEFVLQEPAEVVFWLRYLQRGPGKRDLEMPHNVLIELNQEIVGELGGGITDINIPDAVLTSDEEASERVWTWVRPGLLNPVTIKLAAGRNALILRNLNDSVRYDALFLTSDTSMIPAGGRIQHYRPEHDHRGIRQEEPIVLPSGVSLPDQPTLEGYVHGRISGNSPLME